MVVGVALAAFVVVAAVPVGWQLLGPQRIHGPIFSSEAYSTDLEAVVIPTADQLVHTGSSVAQSRKFGSEEGPYLGFPVLIGVAVVAWCHRRRPTVRALVVTGVVLWVLSLGPHLRVGGHPTQVPLPWDLMQHLPLADNLLPVRLAGALGLVVAALLAIGLDDLLALRADHPAAGGLVVGAALLVGGATLAPGFPYRSSRLAIPSYFTSPDVNRIPDGSLAVLAPSGRPERPQVQLWQAAAGLRFRMAGGYMLVPDSRGHPSFSAARGPTDTAVMEIEDGNGDATAATMAAVAADLRRQRVSTVIVGPMAHRDGVIRLFTRVLAAPPRQTGGVDVWERVLELLPASNQIRPKVR